MIEIKSVYDQYLNQVENISSTFDTSLTIINSFSLDEQFISNQFNSLSSKVTKSFDKTHSGFQSVIKLYSKIASSIESLSAQKDLQRSFNLQKIHLGDLNRL